MPKPTGPQFQYLYNSQHDEHEVSAIDDSGTIGHLRWDDSDGEISSLRVADNRRREGIATALWETAHEEAEDRGITAPEHSSRRTEAGDAWARAVGGRVPDLTDDVDGWSSNR
jgi:ribosomal protein S18 acetylase RimI-like enzyme